MFQLSICAGTVLQDLPFLERVRAIARAGFAVDLWGWEDDALDEIAADPDITIGAIPGWRQGSMVHPDGGEAFFEGVRCNLEVAGRLGCRNLAIATGAEGRWMYEVNPDGPDRCRCAQVVCFPPATVDRKDFAEAVEAYYERFDVAIGEDIPMLERQHRGMRSPFARQGRFSYLEPNVARFADWYAGRLLSAG